MTDAVVAQFVGVEFIWADACTQRGDQRGDLFAGEHFFKAGFFDVEHFTAQWQNRLELTVTTLFGRTARGVTLDDVQFAQGGIFSWQSASLDDKPKPSITPLRRVSSRALRAASRAREASTILPQMILASFGFSAKKSVNVLATISSTGPRTSEETSLSLVCELNFGSGTLTDKTQVKPSRISSPVTSTLAFLAYSCSSIYLLMTRVIAARKPVKWVPPSRCGILLVKHSTCSL